MRDDITDSDEEDDEGVPAARAAGEARVVAAPAKLAITAARRQASSTIIPTGIPRS